MRPYLAILSARFRMLLQYRAAALAGFGTQLFWGWIRVAIFTAFFQAGAAAQPMSLQDTVTYVWLTQAFLLLLPFRIDAEMQAMVRDGSVSYELTRPTDLYWYWYSRQMAARVAPLLLRAGPLLLGAGLFFGMRMPASWTALGMFLLAFAGALVLSSAITTLMSISLLWTLAGDGLSRLLSIIAQFLSGMYIPLLLFPEWSQPLLAALPFRGLMDTPLRLYLGSLTGMDALGAVAHQLLWTGIIVVISRAILARGVTRLVVQGG
ncbi:MAG: ABC-2 family transporter protein [Anaerolineae bacterium]